MSDRLTEAEREHLERDGSDLARATIKLDALRTELALARDQLKVMTVAMEAVYADRERLVEALRPFAALGQRIDADESARNFGDGCPLSLEPERIRLPHHATLGHCRAAAALVAEFDAKGGTT